MRLKPVGLLAFLLILFQISSATVPAAAQSAADLPGLMRQITELAKAGRFAEATPLARQLVATAERVAGKEHPVTATTQSTLAELLILQGKVDEGEPILKRVLATREKVLGLDHADVATTLASLANVAIDRGRYADADRLLQRALGIRQRRLGPEHADTAMTVMAIGRIRHSEARYAEAEQLFRQAHAALKKAVGPEHIQVAVALNNLAEVYKEQGRLAQAETELRTALAIQEKQFGAESIYVTAMLNNLGELRARRGEYVDAEELHRRSLQIKQKALGPDHPDVARSLNNLAIIYSRQGRATEAESLLRRALAILEKAFGKDHSDVASTLNNLADALVSLRRYDEADALLQRSLAIRERLFGKDHASVAVALDNLVAVLRRQDRFAEAEPMARRSLAIREKAFDGRHPLVARSLNQLAVVLDELRRPAEAEPLLRRAISAYEASLGNRHPDFAVALHNLASHDQDLGRWQDAYAGFKRATAILIERMQTAAGPADNSRQGEVRDGADLFRGLIASTYRTAETTSGDAALKLRAEAFETAQWIAGAGTGAAIARMSARIAAGNGELAGLVRERQDLAEQAAAADRALIAVIAQSAQQNAAAAQADLRQRADAITRRMKDIDAALATRFPDYAALTSTAPVSLSETASQLGANEAFLLFAPTRDDVYLWAVTPSATRWVKIPLGTAALDDHVAALRCGLDHTGAWSGAGAKRCMELLARLNVPNAAASKPFDVMRAHELYRALFGQVEDLISGKQLLVVAAGALSSLPFHVLVASPPAAQPSDQPDDYRRVDWLARHAAISVLPSVASLKALRKFAQRSRAPQSFVGFGNPLLVGTNGADRSAFEKQSCAKSAPRETVAAARAPAPLRAIRRGSANVEALRNQPPLPETADELCTVARLLGAPAGAVNLGENATERRIKALSASGELGRARYLHFATHGLLASESETLAQGNAEPALLLTPPSRGNEEDDGLLTASEVAQLKLDADWVIMSACNTAAGDKLDSEVLSGLGRAFFYAGSRALLASHWYVDSNSAVALITKAFAAISAEPNLGRAEALRRSMLALIDAGGRTAHPANWAPFVVVGEGGR